MAQAQGLHIFVSTKQLSSTCHVSSFAALDTDHKHKISLTHFHQLLLSFRRSLLVYPAMFHGRVADQHKSHLSKVVSPSRLRRKPSRPKHICAATRGERIHNSKHWMFTTNADLRNSAITQSTTRLCSSEKRMQTNA